MSQEQEQDYRYVNGRRYHGHQSGSYYLPNDAPEVSRLEIQHRIWRLSLPNSSLHLAPLPRNPRKVVDLGTGTGIWAIEFAQENPASQVLGVDLSAIQPMDMPSNCKFQLADISKPWENFIGDTRLDFIHSRLLLAGIHDWDKYFERAFAALEPGGWLEVQEVRYPMECDQEHQPKFEDSVFFKWSHVLQEAGAKAGTDLTAPSKFKQKMEKSGFREIQETLFRWPLGPWSENETEKEIGNLNIENIAGVAEGMSGLYLNKYAGWKTAEVEKLVKDLRKDFNEDCFSKRYYVPISVHYGRKPL